MDETITAEITGTECILEFPFGSCFWAGRQFACREIRIHTETQWSRAKPLQLSVNFGTKSSFRIVWDHQRGALWPPLFFSRAANTARKAPGAYLNLQQPLHQINICTDLFTQLYFHFILLQQFPNTLDIAPSAQKSP